MGRSPPLEAGRLMSEAVGLTARSIRSMWPVWLAFIALGVGGTLWARANMSPAFELSAEQRLLFVLLLGPPAGLAFGVFVRALLGVGRARWRIDRGIIGYAALGTGLGLIHVFPQELLAQAIEAGIGDPLLRVWGRFGTDALVWWALLWPTSRLLLWQVGLLMGDPAATPARSWQAMRGATWPYVAALVVLSTPFYGLDVWVWSGFYVTGDPLTLAAGAVCNACWDAVMCGLAAAVYRARVLESQRLADVFG